MKDKYFMVEINLLVIGFLLFIVSHVFNVLVFYVGERYAIFMFFPIEIAYMTNFALYGAVTLQLIAISLIIYNRIKEADK